MKNAVIYARSASKNDSHIEEQLKACREYAADNGLNIVAEYVDNNYPGTKGNRPGLNALKADKSWDVMIIRDSARLFRDKRLSLSFYAWLKKEGRRLVSLDIAGGVEVNPMDYLLIACKLKGSVV